MLIWPGSSSATQRRTTPTRFADAPGEWAADGDGISVRLAPGEELTLDGARITGRHHFGQIPERGGLFPSDADGVYEAAKRGGNDILRPRHPDNPLRTGFRGTPAYAPDPSDYAGLGGDRWSRWGQDRAPGAAAGSPT